MDTQFTKNAQNLSRNPLGIIALFLSLIYVLACLVLGVTTTKLASIERLPLIWFVVIFPILILATFFVLVTNHHTKLYAPVDFRDDSGFLVSAKVEPKRGLQSPDVPQSASVQDENQDVENQDDDDSEEAFYSELLEHGSLIGVLTIKIACLSAQHKKAIQLDDFKTIHDNLIPYYCYGYLIATAPTGAIALTSSGNIFSFTNIHPVIEREIDGAIKTMIDRSPDKEKAEYNGILASIDAYFKA